MKYVVCCNLFDFVPFFLFCFKKTRDIHNKNKVHTNKKNTQMKQKKNNKIMKSYDGIYMKEQAKESNFSWKHPFSLNLAYYHRMLWRDGDIILRIFLFSFIWITLGGFVFIVYLVLLILFWLIFIKINEGMGFEEINMYVSTSTLSVYLNLN